MDGENHGKPTIFGNIHIGLPYMFLQGGVPQSAPTMTLEKVTLYTHRCRPEDCESWMEMFISRWKVEISWGKSTSQMIQAVIFFGMVKTWLFQRLVTSKLVTAWITWSYSFCSPFAKNGFSSLQKGSINGKRRRNQNMSPMFWCFTIKDHHNFCSRHFFFGLWLLGASACILKRIPNYFRLIEDFLSSNFLTIPNRYETFLGQPLLEQK